MSIWHWHLWVLKSNLRVFKIKETKCAYAFFLVCFVMNGMIGLPIQNCVYKKKIVPFIFTDKVKQQTRLYLSDGAFINADSWL